MTALRGDRARQRAQCGTLRLKLLRIGAVVLRRHPDRVRLLLSSAYPDPELFLLAAARLKPDVTVLHPAALDGDFLNESGVRSARDPSSASQSTKIRPSSHENAAFQQLRAPVGEHLTRHRPHHGSNPVTACNMHD